MKKNVLIFLFMLCFVSAFSQTVTVIDKSNLQPIKNVILTAGDITATTDMSGQTDITVFQRADKIQVSSSDYIFQTISYSTIQAMNYTIQLTDKSYRTDEIIVSANKFDENLKYLPRQVDVLNREDIKFANTQTSADLLSTTGNIFVQKSQLGGGSPIIRGFEANKVLIMIDGVRLNNIIFRAGHLQNVLRVDKNILGRVEVLYGASSTIYGSFGHKCVRYKFSLIFKGKFLV